ncbi:MAG: dephospho-CoA kinase [Janthinobacterium lividum]
MALRVGLTGGLGSGKSTVAAMLAGYGAHVLSADEIGRALMEPGEPVYAAIVEHFGPEVVQPDGRLDRPALAKLAFAHGRVEELNTIVHPATIARQGERMAAIFAEEPNAVVVVESALLFETRHGDGWRDRFDRLVLVTAPEQTKIERFVARSGGDDVPALEAEARRRLARQIPDAEKAPQCDFVIANDGPIQELRDCVDLTWHKLRLE